MGDVTSTCCQNTTQMQEMGITREVNMNEPVTQQTFSYEPFYQAPDAIRQTFQEAALSRYFKQPFQEIRLYNMSDVWNGDKLITIVRKLRSNERGELSSVFDVGAGTSGRYCTYIKSLQPDNIIKEQKQTNFQQPNSGQQSNTKMLTGLFLIYFPNKQYFLGHITNNQPTNGIFVFKPGCYYVGNIKDLTASGQGMYTNQQNSYLYEGTWSKNLQHGKGRQTYKGTSESYEGEFMYGSKFGMGKYVLNDGRIYEGYFYNGHSDGQGKLTIGYKEWYSGEWKLGSVQGYGEYHYPNGDVYYGEFQNGVKSGKGRYVFAAGYQYDGQWVEGKMHGRGVIKEGYDQIQGQWVEGKKVA